MTDLYPNQADDETVSVGPIVAAGGAFLAVTPAFTSTLVVKASERSDDASGKTYTNGVFVGSNQVGWVVQFKVPKADLPTLGVFWWRCRVIDESGNVQTADSGRWVVGPGRSPGGQAPSTPSALALALPTKVSKAGDTMTGPLVLPGDATLPLQATTKQQVDAARAADAAAQSATSVQTTGGGKESVATIDPANSAATINLALGNVFHILNPAAAGTCTLTLAGATAGKSCGCTIYFHQRSTGNSLVAFAAGTVVPMNDTGVVPPPNQSPNGVAVYSLVTDDGGATTYAWKAGDGVPVFPPNAPTIGAATAGTAQATVAFTPAATGGAATSYTVTSTPGGLTATGASSPLTVSGLTAGTAYTFKVRANGPGGVSAESAASNSVTPTAATVPGAPTIGTASVVTATSVAVPWSAPASNGGSAITGYVVTPYIGAAAQATTTVGNVLTATITGLTTGTAYTFKVAAINAVGTGAQSAASNAVTPATTPASFSNLVHWLEADSVGGSPVDGAAISSWADQSVSAKAASQATSSKQPLWIAAAAGFNNKPVVRFAAASQQQMNTASPVSVVNEAYTFCLVVSQSENTAAHACFYNGERLVGGRGFYTSSPSGGAAPRGLGKMTVLANGLAFQDSTLACDTTATIIMVIRDGAGVGTFYKNGVPDALLSPNTATAAPTVKTCIGGDDAYWHTGDIAFECFWNATRTKAELNQIGQVLATKYGITWTNIV